MSKPHRKRLFGIIGLVVCLILALVLILDHHGEEEAAKKKAAKAPPSVPVTTTAVKTGNIGVYIQALGTVTPIHTVSVVSRVQGQITQVFYKEGQLLKKGDPLLEVDPRPYEAALLQGEGALERDQALLKEAQIDLQRYKLAYQHRAVSRQQLEDQEQLVQQYNGAAKADAGTVETARLNVEYCHITSPIDGRVGLRLVDPGNIVQANSTVALATITQLSPITVIFSVAEDYLPEIEKQIHAGNAMKVDAYDRAQKNRLASGEFLTTDNQIDTTTGTVRIRAQFENADGALFPYQFVNTRLLVTTEQNATLVKTESIQRGSQGAFVYVIGEDKTAKMQKVEVGTSDGDETAIAGAQPGAIVASAGFDKLQDGTKVTVKEDGKVAAPSGDSAGPGATSAEPAHQMAGRAAPSPPPSSEPSWSPSPQPSYAPGKGDGVVKYSPAPPFTGQPNPSPSP